MNSLNQFLTGYIADMEADNKRFIDLMFLRAINLNIDLTCIDNIMQGIKDDQPLFDKWCEVMAKTTRGRGQTLLRLLRSRSNPTIEMLP